MILFGRCQDVVPANHAGANGVNAVTSASAPAPRLAHTRRSKTERDAGARRQPVVERREKIGIRVDAREPERAPAGTFHGRSARVAPRRRKPRDTRSRSRGRRSRARNARRPVAARARSARTPPARQGNRARNAAHVSRHIGSNSASSSVARSAAAAPSAMPSSRASRASSASLLVCTSQPYRDSNSAAYEQRPIARPGMTRATRRATSSMSR